MQQHIFYQETSRTTQHSMEKAYAQVVTLGTDMLMFATIRVVNQCLKRVEQEWNTEQAHAGLPLCFLLKVW